MPLDISPLRYARSGIRAKIRWHLNQFCLKRLALLNVTRAKLTVFDAFGSPGDTLLSAIVCRQIKERFPKVRLNLLTPNPDLVMLDPCLESVNEPEGTFCLWHWYLKQVEEKDGLTHVLKATLASIGIDDFGYQARVYLSKEEVASAKARLSGSEKPIVTINVMSREEVKVWPLRNWLLLLERLSRFATIVQLGDAKEPVIEGILRLAGSLSMRESMAVLSLAAVHIGPDSFLMHAANGLNVPSVIIFGGSRTPQNAGYSENENLFTPMECGPCYIHNSQGQKCAYGVKCMELISVDQVESAVMKIWNRLAAK